MAKASKDQSAQKIPVDIVFMTNCMNTKKFAGQCSVRIPSFEEMNESGFLEYCLDLYTKQTGEKLKIDVKSEPPVADSYEDARTFVTRLTEWLVLWEYVTRDDQSSTFSFSSDKADRLGYDSCLDACHSGVPVADIIA